MISVPAGIQSQLGETISIIADSDFWTRWETLVDVSRDENYDYPEGLLTFVGFGFETYGGKCESQSRCPRSRTFYLQTMETALCLRRSLHRSQSCVEQIWSCLYTSARSMYPPASPATSELTLSLAEHRSADRKE